MVSLLYVALAAEVAFESPPPPSWSRCPVWIGGDVSKLTACNGRGGSGGIVGRQHSQPLRFPTRPLQC